MLTVIRPLRGTTKYHHYHGHSHLPYSIYSRLCESPFLFMFQSSFVLYRFASFHLFVFLFLLCRSFQNLPCTHKHIDSLSLKYRNLQSRVLCVLNLSTTENLLHVQDDCKLTLNMVILEDCRMYWQQTATTTHINAKTTIQQ